jgi:iron complex outermembrane recepter protein
MRLRTTLLASLALAGVSLGGAAPLAAQELSRPDASASDQLQEVVVTAEKRSENILEVPISVSVIDGAGR